MGLRCKYRIRRRSIYHVGLDIVGDFGLEQKESDWKVSDD